VRVAASEAPPAADPPPPAPDSVDQAEVDGLVKILKEGVYKPGAVPPAAMLQAMLKLDKMKIKVRRLGPLLELKALGSGCVTDLSEADKARAEGS
jgi:hypothetical protein